jgi:hypothetical protein
MASIQRIHLAVVVLIIGLLVAQTDAVSLTVTGAQSPEVHGELFHTVGRGAS